jgi:hypothetical protein
MVQFDGFPQEKENKMVYDINHDVDVLSDASDDTLRQSHTGMCKSKLAVDSHFSTRWRKTNMRKSTDKNPRSEEFDFHEMIQTSWCIHSQNRE